MNQLSGAEAFVRMLQRHGVTHVFGLCGDTSLPLYDALARLDHGITHILTRDERSAAYMADGYARVTGRVGVCEGPSGGGATYILPGVVEANESSVPLLAVTTDISTTSRGRFTLTELDQAALFRPVTKWNRVIDRAAAIPQTCAQRLHADDHRPARRRASRPALRRAEGSGGRERCLGRSGAEPCPSRAHGARSRMRSRPRPSGSPMAKAPLFICGGGVVISGAEGELAALAELLGAAVATSISGQGSLPETHPLCCRRGRQQWRHGADARRGRCRRSRRLRRLPRRIGDDRALAPSEAGHARRPYRRRSRLSSAPTTRPRSALIGDARLTLWRRSARRCSGAASRPTAPGLSSPSARAEEEKFAAFRALAQSDATPIRPERWWRSCRRCCRRTPSSSPIPAHPVPISLPTTRSARTGRHFITNRAHGALGYSLPAVIGAHYGRARQQSAWRSWAMAPSVSPSASWRRWCGSTCRSP